jgi:hypothetical protein
MLIDDSRGVIDNSRVMLKTLSFTIIIFLLYRPLVTYYSLTLFKALKSFIVLAPDGNQILNATVTLKTKTFFSLFFRSSISIFSKRILTLRALAHSGNKVQMYQTKKLERFRWHQSGM